MGSPRVAEPENFLMIEWMMTTFGGMSILGWIVLAAGSLIFVFISRKSLLHPRSHGFYRFFVWEILLIQVLRNLKDWFRNPGAGYQVISWLLLLISIGLVIWGVRLLRELGRQNAALRDANLIGVEKTSHLVTAGLYRYIRHPMYSSLLFLSWGLFFKSPSWVDVGWALLCTAFLVATARMEERENIAYFGEAYIEYMKRSRMFIPFVV
jgi:protein-S-isoprenylcysteine O-methyltransferase Ste14